MTLPFEVPADLTTLSADEFSALHGQVRTHAQAVVADETSTPEAILEIQGAYAATNAENTRRIELATQAAAARQELAAGLAPEPEQEPVTEPVETPAPAAPAAPVVPVPDSRPTLDEPAAVEPEKYATLTASVDTARSGQEVTLAEVGTLIERRLSTYSGGGARGGKGGGRALGNGKFAFDSTRMNRHGAAAFNREYPADLRITDGKSALSVLEHAGNDRRLPGGSLVNSYASQIAGKALTAAVGWCAPSETIYDLLMLETRDGILDLPTVQAARGGFFIPEDGGPQFSVIWNGIGDGGDVILSEYDVENGVDKVCVEVPCPPFVEVRLDVAYVCITGNILQTRGYPEAVTRFTQGAMVALDHKVNASVIARMVAQSGAATTIPAIANNTDGASQLLSAVEIAAVDMRYRHRMLRNATLELVLPAWAIAPIRAAIARRAGVYELAVSDQEIVGWFTARNVIPRFVYDWQDAFVQPGLTGAPGAGTAITALPANVRFLLYPPGTWVKAERDVINLDTVYDNALLTQNQYTALFAEDGFNVLQMGPDSRLYETPLNPAGVTGQPA